MTNADLVYLYANLALIALVDALSPVRVAFILLLLSGSRPVLRGVAFIMGVAAFNVVFAYIITQTATSLPAFDIELGPLGLVIGFLLGVGLLIFAVRTWRTKPAAAGVAETPQVKLPTFVNRLSDRVLNGGLSIVFAGGMVMQLLSLKSLILFSFAIRQILEANISTSSAWLALVFFIVIDLVEMIVPTAIFAGSPDNSARLLNQMTQWLIHYSYPILAVAEGALAVYFIIESIAGFLN